jgi:ribonucleoside-triphosphate reductase
MENKIEKVQKRDGTIVPFDQSRIEEAIFKALTATGEGDGKRAKTLSNKVVQILNRRFKKGEIPHVEQIQDIVEEVLILEGLVKTAKAYILYREQRRRIREAIAVSEEAVDRLDQYIEKLDWEVQENANMAFSLQGLNHYGVTYIIKKYWLNKIYPKEIREAYESGDFHIHNLDTLGPYCVGWDLYDLLLKGFGGVAGKVESKPAKHFRSALGQVVNFMYTLQGEAAGAISFSSFDTLLAPFIRYDNLNYQQVKQALQEFLFNMAIPTRVGFQSPFTNITLDLKPSPVFAKMPVIIGGKPQDKTYSEFEEEMKIFNKALYEVYMEGDAKGRPFHFPIPTINITKDFPWDEPAFDGIFEASAKYGTNYFANYINSEMKPEDVRSMCLEANEEVLIRNSKKIKRLSIKEVAEGYKDGEFDKEGWAECKKEGNLEVLSLNPETLKLEWVPVKRFLKIKEDKAVKVITEDGKISLFSLKHPVSVYTPEGIKMKFAKDLQKGDYLLTLKRANENIFSNEYQKIEDLVLDEDLAKILGYFVADGNYLFENRKGYAHFGEPRGMQFTFKTGDRKNLKEIKHLLQKVFNLPTHEKQDPRYNTYYLYVYNTEIARKLYKAGFKKYGRLPQILFNSPKSVIESFLEFYFRGDGYQRRKEIHLNDLELSRDLVLLFSLAGRPVTYKLRKRSQRIYLQHTKSKIKKGNGWLNNPILAERVPGWMAISTTKVPGLVKSRTVGLDTLERYNAHTEESLKIKNSDIYLVRVKEIKIRRYKKLKEFYDIELERNHLFVHSLGQISFNCCRLRLDLTQLYNRGGGGLFGAGSKTGSIGVVTINLPRIGYLSKTKKEFFERLAKVMDLAKASLEIKRKVLENYIEKGLYPYSRYYLQDIKQMRGKYWANHFSTIGLVGMNECLLNFMGENIATKRGRKFALEVLDFMRERLVKYQKETGNIYNLEATPAESTAYRLALKDKERYPDIITAGTKKVPYYTNCVSEDTEILTDKGWRKIDEIGEDEKALTYNVKEKVLEYKPILRIYKYPRAKRKMIRIQHKYVDLLVTPNHFILYSPRGAPHKEVFTFANNLNEYFNIRVAAEYKHPENKKFSDDFLKLIGWIISEGHFEDDNAGIRIYQSSNPGYILEIRETLKNLGINFREWKDTVFTFGKNREETLFRIPAEFGKKIREVINKKEIPREILNEISPRQAEILIETIIKGNGTKYKTYSVINTSNPNLADQLMELAIKAGRYVAVHDYRHLTGAFHIVISNTKRRLQKHQISKEKHVKEVEYEGRVWCVETENRTILVRRKVGNSYKYCITGNSTQLPVNYTDDVFEALKLQDELQCKYSGGTVLHIFLGERMQSGEGVKRLVKKIFENFRLPYITITPTFSICPVHGYISGEHFFCPKCTIKQPCEVYSRIVGYYRPVQQWNLGKQQEFKQRKEFKIKESILK